MCREVTEDATAPKAFKGWREEKRGEERRGERRREKEERGMMSGKVIREIEMK